MTCRNVASLRDRHLDGELSPSLSAEMHAHLLQCPACQKQFEMFRTVGEVIARDRSEPRLRPDFAANVAAKMAKMPARSSQPIKLHTRRDLRERFWRLAFSVSVPAAAAMLFLTVLIWPMSEPTKRQSGGLVAGYVSNRATDVAGVNDVAVPAVDAVKETFRAGDSILQVQKILVDQARQGANGKAAADEAKTQPEITLLNALLFPFNEAIEPVEPETPKSTKDDGVVKF